MILIFAGCAADFLYETGRGIPGEFILNYTASDKQPT
jgi:hypothetical protein